jgi:hypothetical protein
VSTTAIASGEVKVWTSRPRNTYRCSVISLCRQPARQAMARIVMVLLTSTGET